ncbi:MAG: hypothetical protein WC655_01400 [Candidatus Hydrogenedentales bacterium]|jgi:hypothetical protein
MGSTREHPTKGAPATRYSTRWVLNNLKISLKSRGTFIVTIVELPEEFDGLETFFGGL